METKICTFCKKSKHSSCFNKNKSRKDGLQTSCSDCNRQNLKRHYEKNKEHYLDKNIKARSKKRIFIDSIKEELSCKVCGEKESCCLDFHHIDDKDFDLAGASGRNLSIQRIEEEIAKCVCVCANCHRKIHAGVIECPVA